MARVEKRLEKPKKDQITQLEAVKAALIDAAENTLTEKEGEHGKPYISTETWELIEERNEKVKQKEPEKKIKRLNRKIEYEAKKDKKRHLLEQFNENPKDKYKKDLWRSVKNLKKKYTPNFIKMKNKNGAQVPLNKRAEAIAEDLEKKTVEH